MDKATTNAALATVVRVEGSSYRRTGARMLVMDNGVWVGGISGGCLEGDALKRARLAIAKSAASIVTYDTMDDDAYQVGVGLGCNGIIDVLFTPLNDADKTNPVQILKSCVAVRQKHTLLTILRVQGVWESITPGKVIKYTGPQSLHVFENEAVQMQLLHAINNQLQQNRSATENFKTDDARVAEVFIEILPPEINMVLMGCQYDVYPLGRLVNEIGWLVTIVADVLKVNTGIGNIADLIIVPAKFSSILIDEYTVIILMSHDYKTDKYNLPLAMATTSPYIGMLGPKARAQKILQELSAEGLAIAGDNLKRLYAPVGLDIGAVTPGEIALSLVAEVRAVLSHRDGSFLRLRTTSIHERE